MPACYAAPMAKPDQRPANKRTNDPIGMRERMLDAAAQSFQRLGPNAAGVRELRDAAGVTTGAFYHHFPTKKALILAVIEERVHAEIQATWIAAIESAETAQAGIVDVFDGVADMLEAGGSVTGCPLGNLASQLALTDANLRQALVREYDTWRLAIVVKLEADRVCGMPVPLDIESFAYSVVAMFTGAMTLAKSEQSAAALRACAAQLRIMFKM